MGPRNIDKARHDILRCLRAVERIHSEQAHMLRLRAEYTAGLIELDQGENPERALYHFTNFVSRYSKYKPYLV